jgi:hypothetical protein
MFADVLLTRDPAYAPYLRREVIEQSWNDHQHELRDYTLPLWAVMAFEMWAEMFLREGAELKAPAGS